MFNSIKKIKSFTLTELLVVMAISVIVVGLAFSVLRLLRKNLFLIEKNLSIKTEFRLFEEQFNIDLQNYPLLRYDNEKDQMIFSSPLDSVIYQIGPTHLLRNVDTLYYAPGEKEFYFAGNKKITGVMDACKLIFTHNEKTQTIFSYKRTDALTNLEHGN